MFEKLYVRLQNRTSRRDRALKITDYKQEYI
jgi:hypothetical protein